MSNNKKQSILRKAFIYPFIALTALLIIYFSLFFEMHLKYILERSMFESLGSEVNIAELDIKPFDQIVKLKRIQFTDPDLPTQNIFEISDISVSYITKKLLDLSFQSNDVSITDIKFHTKRKYKGKVLDKDKRVLVLKDPSTHKISTSLKNNFKENSFLNLTKSLKGDLSKDEIKQFRDKLDSASLIEDLNTDKKLVESKIEAFKKRIKSDNVQKTLEELKSFKFDSDSSAQTAQSVARSLKLLKETKELKKSLKNQIKEIQTEIKEISNKAKTAPDKLTKDLNMMKSDFNKLDPAVLSEELFGGYFALQVSKLARVKSSMTDSAFNEVKKKSSIDIRDHVDLSEEGNSKTAEEPEDKYSRNKLEERSSSLKMADGLLLKITLNQNFGLKKLT